MADATRIDPLLDIGQTARVLSEELGLDYTENQVRKAADLQKLPFFKDPIRGRRVIRRSRLMEVYAEAERSALAATPPTPAKASDRPSQPVRRPRRREPGA